MTVMFYTTSPTGITHVAINRGKVDNTLCGSQVGYTWARGAETFSGVSTTCRKCDKELKVTS